MNPPASVKAVPLLPAGELASTTDIVKSHPNVPIVDEDHFRSPMGVADWQIEALSHKQGANETVRDFGNAKIHLWKRVNPGISEMILVTHIKLGFQLRLQQMLYSRFGTERMSTVKELLKFGLAMEEILIAEAEAKPPVEEPDPNRESGAAEEKMVKETSLEAEPCETVIRPSPAVKQKTETVTSDTSGGEPIEKCLRNMIQPPTSTEPPTTAVSPNELLRIMQGMMTAQAQQFMQILQQVMQTPVPPILAIATVPAKAKLERRLIESEQLNEAAVPPLEPPTAMKT